GPPRAPERLRPRVAAAVLVEDALLPAEAASLVAAAQADGLDPARARAVVGALAAEHGVTAPPVPAPTGNPAAGADGSAGGDRAPGSAAPSRSPAHGDDPAGDDPAGDDPAGDDPAGDDPAEEAAHPARVADWTAAVSQARAALRAGRPVRAGEFVATARELAGETLPPIRAMDDEVEAAIRAAAEQWAALEPLVADACYHAVIGLARRLAVGAADVPGPGGQLPGELLSLAESRCRAAEVLLARARDAGVDAPAGSRLIEQAAALVSDHPGVLARRRPADADAVAAPPTAVLARREGGSVVVRWQPSPTPGEVRYRVTRLAADGSSRAVGVTTATSLEDGGAPPGEIPAYAVTAGAGGGWSAAARTPQPEPGGGSGPAAGAVGGTRNAADALAPPTGLCWVEGRLRWTWPAGCTEMMVVRRGNGPPTGADDPQAQAQKVTNTRYEIDGGVALPSSRPVHVALFCCARPGGALVVATSAGARLAIPDAAPGSTACGGP
ncbi:hypothetical protein MXD60_22915, partial [Frankia sp. AgB32]|nr:hypothetical protein [Frankia sp. AgB32]